VSDRASHVACRDCVRRSWLLARLSASLDYRCSDLPRLTELLALDDEPLLRALAGTRLDTLRTEHLGFDPATVTSGARAEMVCRHDPSYPATLRDTGAPPMLHVRGEAARLGELTQRPVVALVGTPSASDYGVEVARSLARGLAVSGVTVVAGLTDGIARAAHGGALEVGGAEIAVAGRGLELAQAARRRSLVERISVQGCVVAELPSDCDGRRWAHLAAQRIVARLAELTVVIEAQDSATELASARLALALGRRVAAVPGRVSSRVSRGTNALLMDGAPLIRGPEDVLELLHAPPAARPVSSHARCGRLEPRLTEMLEPRG
jgi:DNA processing protein